MDSMISAIRRSRSRFRRHLAVLRRDLAVLRYKQLHRFRQCLVALGEMFQAFINGHASILARAAKIWRRPRKA
jgi:hypothetical protein